jgi:uncharacterized membrane protein YoaK (UPF0700 family)
MGRDERSLVFTLLALTVTTGFVDAVSFLGLGYVFVSNITGALAILGFAVGGAPGLSVSASLASVAAFLAGAAIGGRLFPGDETRPRRWLLAALAVEVSLVVVAAIAAIGFEVGDEGARQYLLIVLLAGAMGSRVATARELGVRDLNTIVVTLGLARVASHSQLGDGEGDDWRRSVLATIALVGGAALGAVLTLHNDLVVPLAVMAAMVAGTASAYAYASAPSRSRATSPE